MIEKSFQLLRTNTALTTNIKLVVNSSYQLYLESFDINKNLSDDKYKHFFINKENFYEDKLPEFYDGLPASLAYEVKYDNDATVVHNDYLYQFDDTYFSGAKNIKDQWYSEEFEYFAPLYIKKGTMPEGFVILRIDDPIIYKKSDQNFSIGVLNKDNFREEIINKWKIVQFFDMTYQSNFGYWLYKNYTNNERFPNTPLEFDSKDYNFSRWHGIDYETGVYTQKDFFIQDKLYTENQHFDFEKFITQTYQNNKLVFPNILNVKFLFDDSPATPFNLRKYSINRYYGFYIDKLELIMNLTSYVPNQLVSNLDIINNIFVISGSSTASTCPFDNWNDNEKYFINAKKDLYEVKKISQNNQIYYKIIADKAINLSDIDNSSVVYINFEYSGNTYINNIVGYNSNFTVDPFIHCDGAYDCLYGDLYLIKIDNKFHILKAKNENNVCSYYIDSDYAINSNSQYLEYWIDNKNTNYVKLNVVTQEKPLTYPVYRIKFSDIKDWDFDRVNTKFSDFDYEKSDYYETTEHKLYAEEYRDKSVPRAFKTGTVGTSEQSKTLNVSSEYIAGDELFSLDKNNNLSDIWRKNQSIPKWGFAGSNSHSDYAYKLNNSNRIGSTNNKISNAFLSYPDEVHKNLDHLYRIGSFHNNGVLVKYLNQSTNIETDLMNTDSLKFNLDHYVNAEIDYFDYFFKNKMIYQDKSELKTKSTQKYSLFVGGDRYNSSYTLFKGLKINALKINSVTKDINNKIDSINTITSSNFNNYKFSAIVNFCYQYYTCQMNPPTCNPIPTITSNTIFELYQPQYLETVNWNLQFDGVKGYHKTNYDSCSYSSIMSSNNLYLLKTDTKKLMASTITKISDIKNYDNYYLRLVGYTAVTSSTYYNFTGYTIDNDLVRFSGQTTYINTTTTALTYKIVSSPGKDVIVSLKGIFDSGCDIQNFLNITTYDLYEDYECCHNGSIIDTNNIINNCNNAIHIFLNDKYKNILALINIKVPISTDFSDLNNISYFGEKHGYYYGYTLDGTYLLPTKTLDYKSYLLTANNIIRALNDYNTDDYHGFDRNITYHYINENGEYGYYIVNSSSTLRNISNWNNDFSPILLNIDFPDQIELKKNSYITEPVKGPKTNIYDKYKISVYERDIDEPLARKTFVNLIEPKPKEQVHGEDTSLTKIIYRFNGYYEPIFKNIELFNSYDYCFIANSVFTQTFYPTYIDQTGTTTDTQWQGIIDYDGITNYIYIDEIGDTQLLKFKFDFSTLPNNYIISGIEAYYSTNIYSKGRSTTTSRPELLSIGFSTSPIRSGLPSIRTLNVYGNKNNTIGLSESELSSLVNNPTGLTFDISVRNRANYYMGLNNVFLKVFYTISGITVPDDYVNSIYGNYKFNTNLSKFGMIDELIWSKVNPTENVLKLKNSSEDKSVYPMVDEYGYQFGDRFIFKSTWDSDYYVLTKNSIK